MPERSLDELSREELLEELRALRARWREAMTDREVELSERHGAPSGAAHLYEDAPVALLMLDDRGVVQHANRSAAQLLRNLPWWGSRSSSPPRCGTRRRFGDSSSAACATGSRRRRRSI